MTTASLNGVALAAAVPSATILSVSRPLVGARRHSRIGIPGRPGGWTFDEVPGDRNITLVVTIGATSFAARRTAVTELAYWADIGTTARLIIDDEPDRFHDVILADAPDVTEWLNSGDVTLTFLAGPYSAASALSTEALAASGAGTDSGTFSITDRVTVEPVIEVTPTDGNISAFTLTINGDALTWGAAAGGARPGAPVIQEDEVPLTSPGGGGLDDFVGTGGRGYATYFDGYVYDGLGWRLARLASGDTLTVSSISDTVTVGINDDVDLTGAFDVASLDISDVAGTFPLLLEGLNTWALVWTGTATAVTLDITWRERFR